MGQLLEHVRKFGSINNESYFYFCFCSDSGPEGDSLSSPQLPGTTSERVLQSVRGNGKADLLVNQGDAPSQGLAHSDDVPIQVSSSNMFTVIIINTAGPRFNPQSEQIFFWASCPPSSDG